MASERGKKPRVLVCNDDGVNARGIRALAAAVKDLCDLWVIAPEFEQSAASHSLSLHRPLRVKQLEPQWVSIDGTPADCVYLALHHLLKDQRPELVLSGINHGPNLATDVFYSGTVAAAREAALSGLPAIALSLVQFKDHDFTHAAKFARFLVETHRRTPFTKGSLISVNVPAGKPKGFALTRLGRHTYGSDVMEKADPRGRPYFWIGGTSYLHERSSGTDVVAVHDEKQIAVTPLSLDLTHVEALGALPAVLQVPPKKRPTKGLAKASTKRR